MTAISSQSDALPRPITLLINGHSRRGRAAFQEACEALSAAGIELGETILTKSREESERVLQEEIKRGAKTVIIGGGDGTLSTCACTLVRSPVAMGVLPLGTGNTLARSLGIPLDLEGAAQTIANGHVELMDVGRINDRVFLNSISLGISAAVAHALGPETKKRLGLLSWPVVGARVLAQHRALHLKIIGDTEMRVRTHQLLISNGRYVAGPIVAAPNASVQDGYLRVFVLGGSRLSTLLRATYEWLTGRHSDSSQSRYFIAKELRVESLRRPAQADVDGELCENTPLQLSVEPRALRVIVPEDFRAKEV